MSMLRVVPFITLVACSNVAPLMASFALNQDGAASLLGVMRRERVKPQNHEDTTAAPPAEESEGETEAATTAAPSDESEDTTAAPPAEESEDTTAAPPAEESEGGTEAATTAAPEEAGEKPDEKPDEKPAGKPAEKPAENVEEQGDDDASDHQDHSYHTSLERADLSFDYKEEILQAACDAHYEFMGYLTNDECAQKCYETFGCSRFSAGGCSLGCRITTKDVNHMVDGSEVALPHDGQCVTKQREPESECNVYQLSFFHLTHLPGSCDDGTYELHEDINNKAECAHACKNTEGCKKFSHEPNCMGGCRISKSATQCTLDTTNGCAMYELYR